jgi:hypothetical protein
MTNNLTRFQQELVYAAEQVSFAQFAYLEFTDYESKVKYTNDLAKAQDTFRALVERAVDRKLLTYENNY